MKRVFLLLLVLFAMMSCEKQEVKVDANKDTTISAELLQNISNDEQCISPKLSCRVAKTEIEEGSRIFLNLKGDFDLSEPRVIYGYDSRPKYYEYDVLQQGVVVSTVATFAQKEEEFAIAFMFSEPLKRELHQGLEMFEGFYPTVYWGVPSEKFGEAPICLYDADAVTPIEIPEVEETERYQKILANMDDFSRNEATKMLDNNRVNIKQCRKRANDTWTKLENMSEKPMGIVHTKSDIQTDDIISGTPSSYYIIPAYTETLRKTHWRGHCGPCAVAWVYRGLYSHYPCNSTSSSTYINVYGDDAKYATINGTRIIIFGYIENNNNRTFYDYSPYEDDIYDKVANNASRQVDNGLYEELMDHTVRTGSYYPMYQAGMDNALENITNNAYDITTTTSSRTHIQNNHLPVFVMLGTGDSFHYLVAFGTGNTGTKKYIYVTDNGSFTCNNDYYPYWRYEGSNYGIRYKVRRK